MQLHLVYMQNGLYGLLHREYPNFQFVAILSPR